MRNRALLFLSVFVLIFAYFLLRPLSITDPDNEKTAVSRIASDVRGAEERIRDLFGREAASVPKVSVRYAPEKTVDFTDENGRHVSAAAVYFDGLITVGNETYSNGYKKGKTGATWKMFRYVEDVPGYVAYDYVIAHETGHHFFGHLAFPSMSNAGCVGARDWRDNIQIANEGFADLAAFSVLMKKGGERNDPEYERFVALRVGYYLIWKNAAAKDGKTYRFSDISLPFALSDASVKSIEKTLSRHLFVKASDPCSLNSPTECYNKKNALGFLALAAWKAKYPAASPGDGTLPTFICEELE